MNGLRYVGHLRIEIGHLCALAGVHVYEIGVVPSSGAPWKIPRVVFSHAPDDHGIDRVAAEIAAAIVHAPSGHGFGIEQAFADLAGVAGPRSIHWPVRRSGHATAALIPVATAHVDMASLLPMRVRVVDRMVAFDIVPESEDDGTCVLAAISSLRDVGLSIEVTRPWRGVLTGPDEGALAESLRDALSVSAFSGHAQIGSTSLEFADGACRAAGWRHRTTQVEIRVVPTTAEDLRHAVRVLAQISMLPDVADLDASTTRGDLRVLAHVQDPEIFMISMHNALSGTPFRGDAVLGAHGRWRFSEGSPTRIDQGVKI